MNPNLYPKITYKLEDLEALIRQERDFYGRIIRE
jgi:hypothetical protein